MALTDNLLHYWKLDNNSTDEIDTNGTDTAITYGTAYGKINEGADFDGSSSVISFGDIANCTFTNNIFSIAFWMRGDANQGTNEAFVIAKYGASNYEYAAYHPGSNKLHFTCWYLDGHADVAHADTVNICYDGNWHYIVAVGDGTDLFIYRDGVDDTSATGYLAFAAAMENGTSPLMLAKRNSATPVYYNGSIDEVGIWSRVLTGAEITKLYNGGAGLQYPFGEGAAPIIIKPNLLTLGVG